MLILITCDWISIPREKSVIMNYVRVESSSHECIKKEVWGGGGAKDVSVIDCLASDLISSRKEDCELMSENIPLGLQLSR